MSKHLNRIVSPSELGLRVSHWRRVPETPSRLAANLRVRTVFNFSCGFWKFLSWPFLDGSLPGSFTMTGETEQLGGFSDHYSDGIRASLNHSPSFQSWAMETATARNLCIEDSCDAALHCLLSTHWSVLLQETLDIFADNCLQQILVRVFSSEQSKEEATASPCRVVNPCN